MAFRVRSMRRPCRRSSALACCPVSLSFWLVRLSNRARLALWPSAKPCAGKVLWKGREMAARDPIASALCARWRADGASVTRDDWPGLLVSNGEWRVILARNAMEYRLQRLSQGKWVPVYVPGPWWEWPERLAHEFPDLAEGVKWLVEDPVFVAAAFAAEGGLEVEPMERLRYWSAPDYFGVLRSHGNLRSVRDRTGTLYGLQWLPAWGLRHGNQSWDTQAKGERWPELVEVLVNKLFFIGEDEASEEEKREFLSWFFNGLPELAADGPWPSVRTGSTSARRRTKLLRPRRYIGFTET